MADWELTFDVQYVPAIADGYKDATVRLRLDRDIRAGDTVRAVEPDGEAFAILHVEYVVHCTALDAPYILNGLDREYDITSASALLSRLNQHYDEDVRATSPVSVVMFDG